MQDHFPLHCGRGPGAIDVGATTSAHEPLATLEERCSRQSVTDMDESCTQNLFESRLSMNLYKQGYKGHVLGFMTMTALGCTQKQSSPSLSGDCLHSIKLIIRETCQNSVTRLGDFLIAKAINPSRPGPWHQTMSWQSLGHFSLRSDQAALRTPRFSLSCQPKFRLHI